MTLKGSELLERLIRAETKADAAHRRQDSFEQANTRAWEETKAELKAMRKELAEVIGYMNRGKGWAAAAIVLGGVIGGVIVKFLGFWGGGGNKA